jgi:hypothetical protein
MNLKPAVTLLKRRNEQLELFPAAPEPKPATDMIAKSVEQRQPAPRQRPKIEQRNARNRAVEVQRELAFA